MSVSKIALPIAVFAVLLGGCASSFKATHDHDPAHNFSDYRTYAWISEHPMKVGPSNRITNPLLESRIMTAVEQTLGTRNYSKVADAKKADFVVSFTIGSREEIDVDSYPSMYAGYGHPARWGGMYYGYGTETSVRQYTKGMLAIDVFDVETRRPVWHGVATKSISESDRRDAENTIKAAVDAVLSEFPPQ